jgi:hypothetical protein
MNRDSKTINIVPKKIESSNTLPGLESAKQQQQQTHCQHLCQYPTNLSASRAVIRNPVSSNHPFGAIKNEHPGHSSFLAVEEFPRLKHLSERLGRRLPTVGFWPNRCAEAINW